MPTGYTKDIVDSEEELTFKEFALRCVRAMGAFIHMRDEPLNAKLTMPTRDSDNYNKRSLEEVLKKKAEYEEFTDTDWEDAFLVRNQKMNDYYAVQVASYEKGKQRYSSMLVKVQEWEPPTEEHQGFKDFMEEQIMRSMEYDVRKPEPIKQISLAQFKEDRLKSVEYDIEYYKEHLEEEEERCRHRLCWAAALIESLGE